ncbi:MAG: DNA translocase FtsK [Spirochaetaceae bacterium]|nr:DNA translocase FtsK [Spirochaetaceae bacterium]
MAALGAETLLTAPGGFLFSRFHLAALYVPLLLLIGGSVVGSGRLPRRTLALLGVSPILFITSAVFLQVAVGQVHLMAPRVVISAFGRVPGALFFGLIISVEVLGMVKLASLFRDPEDSLFSLDVWKDRVLEVLGFLGLTEDHLENAPAGDDEPTLEDRPLMAYPSFPDAPDPMEDEAPLFQVPPTKPKAPGSPAADPAVSELLRRVLTQSPAKPASNEAAPIENVLDEEAPNRSAFLPPEEFTPAPGDLQWAESENELEPDPAFAFLAERDEIPEEDRDVYAISEKLDPQGLQPEGVLTPAAKPKIKTKSKRRKKYDVPVEGVLADYPDADFASIDDTTRRAGEVLEQTLKEFKIDAKVTGIRKGPVITMYELLPSPGVKISRIVNLQDNIALRLAASRVRMVAPIPGKHAVGIEVPNKKRAIVSFSSLVSSEEFLESEAGIPVVLGKDISGGNQIIDLTRTPHLLIAGATGSGKSVCVNSLIGSILYSRTPQEVKMIMVDPKIVELKLYNDIPHLLTPVITEPKKAIQALQWCLYEMERRYSLLDSQGVRDMKTYNKRVKDRKLATEPLPYIVVLVDEFADLMATSGKELEGIVARLAAMSRAVGIHLVLATQRPSVDVITGLIKANFPSRIAFMVAGKTDSRIIIDTMGAEKLLGRGDMLFTSAWDPFPSRMQGAFLAEEEVERMAEHVKTLGEPDYIDDEMFFDDEDEQDFHLEAASGDDPMYNKALEIVVSSRKASASYLQRRLKIGYNRAARLVEEMERRGIVGPANGSKPRDLIHIPERFMNSSTGEDREPSSA